MNNNNTTELNSDAESSSTNINNIKSNDFIDESHREKLSCESVTNDSCESVTTDVNQSLLTREVLNDNFTAKNALSDEKELTDVKWPSSVQQHSKTFNELRALFCKGNDSPVIRPNSPGLDLTPVKEKQGNKHDTLDVHGLYNGNNIQLSELESNFESQNTINAENSNAQRSPLSFEVDLENCVTRDCVAPNNRDSALEESINGVTGVNGACEPVSVDCAVNGIPGTFDKQQNGFSENSRMDVSKTTKSWEISLDDESASGQPLKKRKFNKKLGARFKTSSPEATLSSKCVVENLVSSQSEKRLHNADQTVVSKTPSRSFSFEIAFDGRKRDIFTRKANKQGLSKKCPESNQTLHSKGVRDVTCLSKSGPYDLPVKETEGIKSESLMGDRIISQSNNLLDDVTPASQNNASKSDSIDVFPKKEHEGENSSNVSTCGISFDISFDEDPFPKPKLAPKHIRLKMVKTKRTKEMKYPKKSAIDSATSTNVQKEKPQLSVDNDGPKRDTYTLDEVSQTLQKACEKGQTLAEALDDLSRGHDLQVSKDFSSTIDTCEAFTKVDKRGTYSLDEVSKCLVDAANDGQTVTEALDSLAHSEERHKPAVGNTVNVSPNRGTYDLDDVSTAIDIQKSKGNSLEQALEQLTDEVESAVQSCSVNRGTYDLEDVSKAVDALTEQGLPAKESLRKIANPSIKDNASLQEVSSTNSNVATEPYSDKDKRGTYNLDDIADHLDSASNSACSVIETLSDISGRTPNDSDKKSDIRNTYTLDEVAHSLEMAKTRGIPIVEALSDISNSDNSTPESRRTYSLSQVAESLESARSKGLPIVMALENLVCHGDSLRGPAEVAVHRRQEKLTNRKTYALASPLETIGEDNQLRLFDGASRKLLPPMKDPISDLHTQQTYSEGDNEVPSGTHVMQTLDLLTSACEALLKSPPRPTNSGSLEEQSESNIAANKAEDPVRRTYSLEDVSDSLESAEDKGIPVVEALESLTTTQAKRKFRVPRAIRKGGSKSDSSINIPKAKDDRQTYSLDSVSTSVEAAKAKGIPVIAALDELTESLAKFSATGAQSMKSGKKPIKKPDRPSIRKREAARLERSGVRSEVDVEVKRTAGNVFPISYPPAMRNSYSLDDVASAFEMAYKTGASFEDFLPSNPGNSDPGIGPDSTTTVSIKIESKDQNLDERKEKVEKSDSAISLTKNISFTTDAQLSSSDSDLATYSRKGSTSSDGSICSAGSADSTLTRETSGKDICKDNTARKPRKFSNGPFKLRRSRRNSPSYSQKHNVVPSQDISTRSEQNVGKDVSGAKRGTYDLLEVSKELDHLKDQGIPIVRSLDKLAPSELDSIAVKNGCSDKRGTFSFEDTSQCPDKRHITESSSMHHDFNNLSPSVESIPKRSTYILENDGQKRNDSSQVSEAAQQNHYESPNSCAVESRKAFNLDRVEHSIADAHKSIVPAVEVLSKPSNDKAQKDKEKRSNIKRELKALRKTQKDKGANEFFIEYFPPKSESKSPKFKMENDKAVEVLMSENAECETNSDETPKLCIDSFENKSIPISDGTSVDNTENEPVLNGQQSSSQPRWKRTGSYIEALDSYQQMIEMSEVEDQPIALNNEEQKIDTPAKDSQSNGEAVSKGRPTWRTSESVLGQILSLMDNAEERGVSIADALEQAAEMSEKEGQIEESKDEDETTNPQHLALLTLNFEEKRRQIEAERQRSHEHWEDERRKIGETTFWYTIGRAQGNDKDAGKKLPARHEKPAEPPSPGQPTPPIGRSTPFECISPMQTKYVYQSPLNDGYQSPRSHAQGTTIHGYHQGPVLRPGLQHSAQSPVIPYSGFQFPSTQSPTCLPTVSSSDYHANQQDLQRERNILPADQEYETRQFRLSEYALQQDRSPSPSSQNEPTKSPIRKCWEVNPSSATAVFAASSTEGVALHVEEAPPGEENASQLEDPAQDVQSKKGVAMFIGDTKELKPEENIQGLTPEQQKKRDRFLKSRQKKHEEEKIRRDAENEKKRLRELKQKELEGQKRLEEEQKREEQRRLKQPRERTATSNGESASRPMISLQEDNHAFNEFSGPRCYVKPSGKSNRKLISNAISHVCLSGTVNKENKEKCLQAIADSPGFHFIVLFKDGLKFRGLYMLNPETEQAFKVFGIGPKVITSKMVDCVYKYSSGGKEFTKIPSKTLSISVDGVAILKTYWQSNKPNVASKTQSNLKRPPRPPQR